MIAPVQDALDRLDDAIRQLKTAYEKYFAGVERTAPEKQRQEVRQMMARLIRQPTKNTAWRFRVQSLQASLITHEAYWDRVVRQIEEGTYHRDLFRLRHRTQNGAGEAVPAAASPGPAAAATEAPPPADTQYPEAIRKLYDSFVAARQKTGETRPLSIDALATTVRRQIEAIRQQYKCSRVEFKVTVKDGKAILTAVPKG